MSKNPRGANSSCCSAMPSGFDRSTLHRLDAAAVADRGHRRLLDRDEDVALFAAAVRQLVDADAPEEAERAQPAPAFDLILKAERLAGPELQLAQDDVLLRVPVADDQDVVDDRLRAFLDGEGEVDARSDRR